MQKITVCFDIDGTLISNDLEKIPLAQYPVANERVRSLLVTLASFKNVEIAVWSGGGELYCRQVCNSLGISKYVKKYADKKLIGKKDGHPIFKPDFTPDIAIDDIQDCVLGKINLIVREK
jgi:phosphoserine phosphatase